MRSTEVMCIQNTVVKTSSLQMRKWSKKEGAIRPANSKTHRENNTGVLKNHLIWLHASHIFLCVFPRFTPHFSLLKMGIPIWNPPKLSLYLYNPGFSETFPWPWYQEALPSKGYIKVCLSLWAIMISFERAGGQPLTVLAFFRPAEYTRSMWGSLPEQWMWVSHFGWFEQLLEQQW